MIGQLFQPVFLYILRVKRLTFNAKHVKQSKFAVIEILNQISVKSF